MSRITKTSEVLDKLHLLVTKQADLAQTNISGVPGTDTKVTSVSEETETTNKNDVGPEKLNDKQKYEQKPSDDGSEPLDGAKAAEEKEAEEEVVEATGSPDISKIGQDILAIVQDALNKQSELAQTNISGKPGADTNITAISDKTETTNKNDVGPEKLNDKQKYKQDGSKDSSEPLAGAKKAEDEDEAVKTASYNIGAQLVELMVKQASQIKLAQEQFELEKAAGRRDMDNLIALAAQEFQTQQAHAAEQEKQAEAAGAAYFEEMFKQAQLEYLFEENNALKAKIAEFESKEKAVTEKTAAEQRDVLLVEKISSQVLEHLKRELKSTPAA